MSNNSKFPFAGKVADLKAKILDDLNGISTEKWSECSAPDPRTLKFKNAICNLIVECHPHTGMIEYSFYHKTIDVISTNAPNPIVGYTDLKMQLKQRIRELQDELKKF